MYRIFPFLWDSWDSRDSHWYFREKRVSFSTKFSREKLRNEIRCQPYSGYKICERIDDDILTHRQQKFSRAQSISRRLAKSENLFECFMAAHHFLLLGSWGPGQFFQSDFKPYKKPPPPPLRLQIFVASPDLRLDTILNFFKYSWRNWFMYSCPWCTCYTVGSWASASKIWCPHRHSGIHSLDPVLENKKNAQLRRHIPVPDLFRHH